MKEGRRRGRKAEIASPGIRVSLGLKVTPSIKNKLDAAAKENGRTQSQEAEVRLEQSFRGEAQINQVLELAYGPQLAAFLLLLGNRVRIIGTLLKFVTNTEQDDNAAWLHNPYIFEQTTRALNLILDALRPAGSVEFHNQPGVMNSEFAELSEENMKKHGETVTRNDLYCIAFSHPPGHPELVGMNRFYETIREMLGPEALSRISAKLATPEAD